MHNQRIRSLAAVADVDIPAGVQPGAQDIWLVAPSATVSPGVMITTPAAHR